MGNISVMCITDMYVDQIEIRHPSYFDGFLLSAYFLIFSIHSGWLHLHDDISQC